VSIIFVCDIAVRLWHLYIRAYVVTNRKNVFLINTTVRIANR